MELAGLLNVADKVSAYGVLLAVATLVITDKLVWHKRLKEVEERATRWERVAIEALTIGAQAGVHAAELTADVVSAMPNPAKQVKGV